MLSRRGILIGGPRVKLVTGTRPVTFIPWLPSSASSVALIRSRPTVAARRPTTTRAVLSCRGILIGGPRVKLVTGTRPVTFIPWLPSSASSVALIRSRPTVAARRPAATRAVLSCRGILIAVIVKLTTRTRAVALVSRDFPLANAVTGVTTAPTVAARRPTATRTVLSRRGILIAVIVESITRTRAVALVSRDFPLANAVTGVTTAPTVAARRPTATRTVVSCRSILIMPACIANTTRATTVTKAPSLTATVATPAAWSAIRYTGRATYRVTSCRPATLISVSSITPCSVESTSISVVSPPFMPIVSTIPPHIGRAAITCLVTSTPAIIRNILHIASTDTGYPEPAILCPRRALTTAVPHI